MREIEDGDLEAHQASGSGSLEAPSGPSHPGLHRALTERCRREHDGGHARAAIVGQIVKRVLPQPVET
jgi:hypothetical protein